MYWWGGLFAHYFHLFHFQMEEGSFLMLLNGCTYCFFYYICLSIAVCDVIVLCDVFPFLGSSFSSLMVALGPPVGTTASPGAANKISPSKLQCCVTLLRFLAWSMKITTWSSHLAKACLPFCGCHSPAFDRLAEVKIVWNQLLCHCTCMNSKFTGLIRLEVFIACIWYESIKLWIVKIFVTVMFLNAFYISIWPLLYEVNYAVLFFLKLVS